MRRAASSAGRSAESHREWMARWTVKPPDRAGDFSVRKTGNSNSEWIAVPGTLNSQFPSVFRACRLTGPLSGASVGSGELHRQAEAGKVPRNRVRAHGFMVTPDLFSGGAGAIAGRARDAFLADQVDTAVDRRMGSGRCMRMAPSITPPGQTGDLPRVRNAWFPPPGGGGVV